MNTALILSGGTGSRLGSELPKQYLTLAGKEVIAYTIETFQSSSRIDSTVIVAESEYLTGLSNKYGVAATLGGASRNESLRNGLEYIKANCPTCEKIFINEAARPFITADTVNEYLGLLDEYDAVITAQHITDSLGKEGEAVTDRSLYYLIQAPEAFRFNLLYDSFKANSPITATVQQLPPQSKVYKYFGFRGNIKITYPEDLILAEQLMRRLL
jgi:2-C-methyl-D-erythritol 4-phosphate cytidylyltransferase